MLANKSTRNKVIGGELNSSANTAKGVLESIIDCRDVLSPVEGGCKAGSYDDNCGCQQLAEVARAGCYVVLRASVEGKNSPPFRVSGFTCAACFEVDL